MITIDRVKDDLTKEQVESVMQKMIDKNIFETRGGELKEISYTKLVTTDTKEIISR